jgi:sugar phosphate isomerase/epimerase
VLKYFQRKNPDQEAVKALKAIGYDRTITLEVFTSSNDAKSSADKLITMWSA